MFGPTVHWVSGIGTARLGLMARPRGGEWLDQEISALRQSQVDTLVSLLEPTEVRELELKEESSLCAKVGIAFRAIPIPDRGVPESFSRLAPVISELHAELLHAKAVVIHCRAGIGRTGLVAGCLLHCLGVPYKDIFHLLSRSRGVAVPDTSAQIEWVERFTHAHKQAL